MRILVVEDELDLQEVIAEGLRIDGYAVDVCSDGNVAYEMIGIESYDLILLDLNLPGIDGLELLEKIREENQNLKVLILSARTNVSDKVNGLDGGANDYLCKPFDFEELEARIRNLLRRQFIQLDSVLTCGQIRMDLSKREVYFSNQLTSLTKKEFALLEYFMLNQNKVISQEELISHIWNAEVDSFSNAIRVHMASLRKKMKGVLGYDPIVTKIGEGYLLQASKGSIIC